MKTTQSYQAYLIRLWPGQREGRTICRATLDSVKTGQHYDFAELDELVTFLQNEEAILARQPETVDPS